VSEAVAIRRMLAAMFVFGSLGTGAELVLLEHTEDVWQSLPLALIALGCLGLCGVFIRPGAATLRSFQVVTALFVASGAIGLVLHYQGNVEFELELHPDATGFELFWQTLKGATPALAPGTMILLGALGLACTYKHPALKISEQMASTLSGGVK
jgi:hypothetical protein